MNTIGFNPNYSTGFVKSNHNNKNVNFKGAIGDKFVEEIVSGHHVKPEKVMEAVKGTFGPKTNKVADVVESFTSKIAELTYKNNNLEIRVNDQANRIADFPVEKEIAVNDMRDKMIESYTRVIKGKDEALAQKDAQIEELKKYESMGKVKSVEEIGVVMPDTAVKTLGDMVTHREDSTKSMLEFLTTGKGQDKAIEQIERNNTMLKAHSQGITDIPEVQMANDEAKKSGIWFSSDSDFTLNMIGQALKGWDKGSYLNSTPIKTQIKENAMALLSPMADERYSNTGIKSITEKLDKTVIDAQDFHKGFAKGKEKFYGEIEELKDRGKYEYEEIVVPFSTTQSKIVLKSKENPKVSWERNYDDLARIGNHPNR